MTIALRGSAAVPSGNPTTTYTVTIDAAVVTDDQLYLAVTSRDSVGAGTLAVTDNDAGGNTWTKIGNSADHKATLWYKRATAATASKTITVANAVGSCSGVLKAFSGGSTVATPYQNVTPETNASADETATGWTPTGTGHMICAAIFNTGNDNAVTSLTCTTPGALTATESLSTGGSDCATSFGHALQSAGPTATGNFTWAQTDGTTITISWSIIPNQTIAVPAGSATPSGLAPIQARGVLHSVGAVVFAGAAAIASLGFHLAMPAGSAACTGQAVGIGTIGPSPGSVLITGQAPTLTVTSGSGIAVPAGGVALSGQASTLAFMNPVPVGSLAVVGTTPSMGSGLNLPAGVVTAPGLAETIGVGVAMPAGAAALTAQTVGIGLAGPPPGVVTFTGYQPTVQVAGSTTIALPVGTVTLAGLAETLAFKVAVPAGASAFSGAAATVSAVSGVAVPVGSVAVTGRSLALAFVVQLQAGSLAVTGQAPSPNAGITRALPVGTLGVSGTSSILAFVLPLQSGALTLTGRTPQVAGSAVSIAVPVGSLSLSGALPTLSRGGYETLVYVGGAEISGNSGTMTLSLTALTGGIASSPSPGDLVIVSTGFVSTANGNPGVSTAGYTEVADLYADDTRDANFSVNYKIMGASPDASVACNGSGLATNGAVAVCQVWRGIDQATPMDVTPATATNINSSIPDSPSITPLTPNAVLIATGLGTSTAVDTTVTAPTGYSNQVDISVDPGNAVTVGIASKVWSGSGADNPAAWTNWTTSTGDSWGAVTLALRPATIVENVPVAIPAGALTVSSAEPSFAFLGPAPGTLTLLGRAPSVLVDSPVGFDVPVPMPVGALVLSGQSAGVVGTGRLFVLPAGVLSVAGQYVGVKFLDPAPGAVAFTGTALTLRFTSDVPAGALISTGQAPVVIRTFTVVIPAASLIATGLTPTPGVGILMPVGVLASAGASPRLATHLLPQNGALALTGLAPLLTFSSNSTTRAIPAGSATLTGQGLALSTDAGQPAGAVVITGASPSLGFALAVPAGSLSVTGAAIAVNYPRALDVGVLQITGQAFTIHTTVGLPAGVLTITGLTGSLAPRIDMPIGSLAVTGLAAQLHLDQVIAMPAGIVTTGGAALTILRFGALSPDAGAVIATGYSPALAFTVSVPAGSVVASGIAATPQTALSPTTGALTLTGRAPSLNFSLSVDAGSVVIAGTTLDAQAGIQIPIGAVVFMGSAPSLAFRIAIPAGQLAILVDDPNPTVAFRRIDLSVGAVSLVGYAPLRIVAASETGLEPRIIVLRASLPADLPAAYSPVILLPASRT